MENQEKKQFKLGQIWRFTPPNAPSPLDLLLEIHGLKPLHYYTVEYVNNKGEAKFFGVDGYFTTSFFELYSEVEFTEKEFDLFLDTKHIHQVQIAKELLSEASEEQNKKPTKPTWYEKTKKEVDEKWKEAWANVFRNEPKNKIPELIHIKIIDVGNFSDGQWCFKTRQNSEPALKKQSLSEEFDHYKKDSEIAHKMMMSVVEKLQAQIEEKDAKIKNLVSIIDNIKEILE